DRLYLPENFAHIDRENVRIFLDERRQPPAVAVRRAKCGNVSRRHIVERTGWKQREEIDAEAVPVDLAKTGHFCRHAITADIERQRVAEVHAERLRDAVLERDAGIGATR